VPPTRLKELVQTEIPPSFGRAAVPEAFTPSSCR
jgi:hypothetical protein